MTMTATDVSAYRERHGWTQQKMATICGVTTRTVRRWERVGAPELVSKLLSILSGAHIET